MAFTLLEEQLRWMSRTLAGWGREKPWAAGGGAGKIPVIWHPKTRWKVRVEVAQNVSGETLLRMAIKKVKCGSLLYTDKFQSYNGLISYGFVT